MSSDSVRRGIKDGLSGKIQEEIDVQTQLRRMQMHLRLISHSTWAEAASEPTAPFPAKWPNLWAVRGSTLGRFGSPRLDMHSQTSWPPLTHYATPLNLTKHESLY